MTIERHVPCNLFDPGEDVALFMGLADFPAGPVAVTSELIDASGRTVTVVNATVRNDPVAVTRHPLQLGRPGRGYYELHVRAASGAIVAEKGLSLGVMETASRAAREARDGGYVFGLKWWSGVSRPEEILTAMGRLGLQWTRVILPEKPPLTVPRLVTEFPMNAVIKVERFPAACFDEAKYGPLPEWEKKYGRGGWMLKTLPRKQPYQQWLREQLALLPADQQVFEIWNEPWDKMAPEDFATLAQWIVEVILQERPAAIVGPNLYGRESPYEYDARVIAAGGLRRMRMVALHPYGNAEDRAWLRHYRSWLKEQTGADLDLYITEYGSHSTPEGPARRSEIEQARRTVRQSLALYAEGVKALTPHWVGQLEHNRSYVEDWFGFFRRNEEPKPVLLAHANCARLIDGSRYLGDLWYGPQVAAELFDRDGQLVLALWTLDKSRRGEGENTATAEIELSLSSPDVTAVDLFGRETVLKVTDGKLRLRLDEAPVYLVGVDAALAGQASRELRPDRWPAPVKPVRLTRTASKLTAKPTLDGRFADWPGAAAMALVNPKVNGADCSGTGYIAWDDTFLYIGVDVRDNELLNQQPRARLYRQDCLELFLSTEPRESGSGFGPHDLQLYLAPASGEGRPVVGQLAERSAGIVTDIPQAKFFAGPRPVSGPGWAIEAAIPWRALGLPEAPASGTRLAAEMLLNDADSSHERFKLPPEDAADRFDLNDPSSWSWLLLQAP